MTRQRIGFLHPGAMGISLAATAQNSGHEVYWAAAGRSAATGERARQQGLRDAGTLEQLCASCDAIVSVCPPHAAEAVAAAVIAAGFTGSYLDANAIAPERARQLDRMLAAADIRFTDGGIVGGPAWRPGTTWLYLAGPDAADAAAWFAAGPLETTVLGPDVGDASALKMCYAAFTKGSTALLSATVAAAQRLGVAEALYAQWERDTPALADQRRRQVQQVTAKAWRFEGEMEEIAATFGAAGLPTGFHLAAAELYGRLAHLKDASPTLDEVIAALLAAPADRAE